jgi:hypothetical protein
MNTTAWGARPRVRHFVPDAPIELAEVTLRAARDLTVAGMTTLRFHLIPGRRERLEALREARRAMIREQRTRGLEEGEPSLSEAVFSATGVLWEVPSTERGRCREMLAELIRRANRLVDSAGGRALKDESSVSGPSDAGSSGFFPSPRVARKSGLDIKEEME